MKANANRAAATAALAAMVWALAAPAPALTRYVWTNSPSPGAPYTNWNTAAHTITAAVQVAVAGDVVCVTNGVYKEQTIVITNAITLRSVNGWSNTVLDHRSIAGRVVGTLPAGAVVEGFTILGGSGNPGGGIYVGSGAALRSSLVMSNSAASGGGIYAAQGSLVSGCVVRANAGGTGSKGGGIYCATGVVQDCQVEQNSAAFGGGIYCAGGIIERCIVASNRAFWTSGFEGLGGGLYFEGSGTATHCRVEGNQLFGAYKYGGGVYFGGGGALRNSAVLRNTGQYGGGVFADNGGSIESCTIAGNSILASGQGGGVYNGGGSLLNTIISGNTGGTLPDVYVAYGSADYCLSPDYLAGTGNIMGDPQFIYPEGGDFHLSPLSLGKDTGSNQPWMTGARDLDGRDRILEGTVDRGAYETPYSCNFAGTPRVGTVPLTVVFTGEVAGVAAGTHFQWDLDADGSWDAAGLGLVVVTNVYTNTGIYSVRLAVSNTVGSTAVVSKANYVGTYPAEVFVSPSGSHTPPFATWDTAATNIQAAANLGMAGTVVWVTNGTYVLTATVTVPQGVTIQSVNGYSNTVVDGNTGTWRCVWLSASGAVLRGFTIMRGNASGTGGGGVYATPYTRVHDCLIMSNRASTLGGGVALAANAIVSNCVLTGNWCGDVEGGGGVYSTGGLIEDCVISDNVTTSPYGGAGAYCVSGTRMRRCIVTRNRAGLGTGWQQGAGIWAQSSVIENCEVSFNTAPTYYAGGGIMCYAGSVVSGCTVRANVGWECGGIYLNGGTVLNSLIENNTSGFYRAGGVEVKVGSVESCVIRGNYAEQTGGGVSILNGTVRNCLIVDNVAGKATLGIGGGGVGCEGSGVLENCTVARNSAGTGGGIWCLGSYVLDVRNTIVYGNTADTGANYLIETGATFTAVCTEPLVPGPGNTDEDPGFAAPDSGNFRLLPGSPCLDRGTNDAWMLAARDLDGNERVLNEVVDLGAYEAAPGPLAGNAIADVAEGPGPRKVVFEAFVSGTNTAPMFYSWDFNGDGTADLEGYGLRVVTSSYAIGRFDLGLTVSNAVGETYTVFKPAYVKVGPAIAYVRRSGSTPVYPFTNWVNAATNIQTAVDAGEAGTLVLVTDGTYRVSAPLAVRNRITVRSVRGAAFTSIDGGDTNRCVELRHPDAIVNGFTLKNGYAYGQNGLGGAGGFLFGGGLLVNSTIVSNRTENYGSGAGVVCFWGGSLSNCVVTDNNSADEGGGLTIHGGGSADNCTFARNIGSGSGGGVHLFNGALRRSIMRGNQAGGAGGGVRIYGGGLVEDCLIESNSALSGYSGGGVASDYNPATVSRCIIRGNACSGNGGGIGLSSGGLIENCMIYSNRAGYAGGGVAIMAGGILQNSTVIENQATNFGGGLYTFGGATTRNSILFFNTCGNGSNFFEDGHVETWFNNCIAPLPGGSNNIAVNPLLAPVTAGVYRLSAASPCMDAGTDEGAPAADAEGIARPLDGNADTTVAFDIGASEFAHTNVDADADGLSDAAEAYVWRTGARNPDSDADNMLDGAEIRAGTDPWSPSSYLGVESAASAPAGGYIVQWQSVDGKRYRVARATNLVAGSWSLVFTNILGVAPMNTVTDSTAIGTGPWTYRIELE